MKIQEMFSNLKIKSKLSYGFGAVIVLLFIVSAISYFSLLNINRRIILAEEANDIEFRILMTRKVESEYKRTGNKMLAEEIVRDLVDLEEHAQELRKKINNKVYLEHIDNVLVELDNYLNAFNSYILANNNKAVQLEEMHKSNIALHSLIDDMTEREKSSLEKQLANRAGNLRNSFEDIDKLYQLKMLLKELSIAEKDYVASNGAQEYLMQFNTLVTQIEGLTKSIKNSKLNQTDIDHINSVISWIGAYKTSFESYHASTEQKLESDIKLEEAAKLVEEGGKLAQADQIYAMENSVATTKIIIIVISLLSIALGMFFSNYISMLISRPIGKLKGFAELVANGNLTVENQIDQEDEVGALANSFETMKINLRKQLQEITEGVNVLSSSSSEIMAMVSQLASTSAETATSVSETSTTVEEVKQTAEISNQKASEVSESAQKIALISQDGNRSVKETIEGMGKIKQQMELIAEIVIQLSDKSQAIGDIATTVNELAEQSNLLAVNASIEAAKAGEHGKGFSVVAQKIDNLAERSKESTIQIRAILADIQKGISSAVMATEQGGKVIDEGMNLSNTANEVITTLAAGIEEASQSSLQIAASSQQQLVGMDQITSAIENIKEASIQASSSTKQTEQAVAELNGLGNKLMEILKLYKL